MEPLFLPSDPVSVIPVRRHFRFKQPAGTSRGVYLDRTVWYVVVSRRRPGQPPAIGIGECALLPDLSCDAVPGYEDVLRRACDALRRTGLIDREALRPYPSILFGLETAALSFRASLRTGDCLRLFDTPFSRGEQGIPINGLVWMGSFDEMQARLEAKLAEGSRCVKLKIGAIRFDDELALIRHVRRRFSPADVELRVDANGGFTPEEAPRRLEQLAAYGIHSIGKAQGLFRTGRRMRTHQHDKSFRKQALDPFGKANIALDGRRTGIQHEHRIIQTIRFSNDLQRLFLVQLLGRCIQEQDSVPVLLRIQGGID